MLNEVELVKFKVVRNKNILVIKNHINILKLSVLISAAKSCYVVEIINKTAFFFFSLKKQAFEKIININYLIIVLTKLKLLAVFLF